MDEAAFHELVARRQSDRDYDAGRAVEKEKLAVFSKQAGLRRRLAIRSRGIL